MLSLVLNNVLHFYLQFFPDRYDVVISAYMRGGSTLAGQILGYHSDSFYVYEPFWKMAPWVYWKGNDTVCRSDRTECRLVSAITIAHM